MMKTCNIAFKEWASVCRALAHGEQTLLLRKGGIQESGDEFRVEHDQFWLLPTNFHQHPDELTPQGRHFLQEATQEAPSRGFFRVTHWCHVFSVHWIENLATLDAIADKHILSTATVHKRFEYRTPGIFVLIVRVHRATTPVEIEETPQIAGCRSWVTLPAHFSTENSQPVLADADFARKHSELSARLG